MMALPTLDFGKYLHGTQEEKVGLGVALIQAFKDFGFVKLLNHGIPEETVKDFLDLVSHVATQLKSKLTWSRSLSSTLTCPERRRSQWPISPGLFHNVVGVV
jgi:isopenicillin N synthase-like dioxygenase